MNRWCSWVFRHRAKGPTTIVAGNVAGRRPSGDNLIHTKTTTLSRQVGAMAALLFAMAAALPAAGQTNIVADPSAPANQRPTVLAAPNGVPAVNIQTPSSAGVSRNTYSQFDVGQQGAILNNARTTTQTQLGGWVQGNPWLATGSAKVILNEVNSSNPSLLGGYVEVAGQRAEVVIANPAGIHVDGGGFINASRATLTTGTPLFNGSVLEGYEVRDGHIGIVGAGLDATQTDFTDLIARSVEVNAGIWANQLAVTTGANRVDAAHATATPIAASGKTPALAIDTAQLGGMYAGKITLIGTEAGVGVRNAGTIGAGAGEVAITAEGRLENSGRIAGAGSARIDSTTGIANSGTISSQASAALSTRGDLDNSGVIAAQGDLSLTATGANSAIVSTSGSVLAAGVQADGSLGTGGALTVTASQKITARGRNLAGGEQTMRAGNLDLTGSQTSARTLDLSAGAFDLDLTGADVAVGHSLTLSARHTLRTDGAFLSAGRIAASAYDLSNIDGDIFQIGDGDLDIRLGHNFLNAGRLYAVGTASLEIDGTLVNQATMQAGHALRLKAAAIDNGSTGTIAANRLDLAATGSQGFTNRGLIDGLKTFVEASTFANLGTGRVYGDRLALAATALHNVAEQGASPVIAARDRLDLGVAALDNREHALLFSAGDLAIGGGLDAHHCAVGRATTLDNASATIEALGNLTIGADQLTNGNLHFSTTTATVSATPFHQYWGHEFGVTPLYDAGTPGVYVYAGHENIQVLRTPAGDHRYWSENEFTRTVTETRIASSDPARILAGGAIDLAVGTLLNDKSHIVAGGSIGGSIDTLRNTEVAGERVVADLGTSTVHAYVHRQNKSDYTKTATTIYNPPPTIEAFTLTPTVFQQHTVPTGTSTRIDDFATHAGTVVRSVAIDTRLPAGSLFVTHTGPTSHYLIETDPRFASYRQWLSSEYLLNSLGLDPALTQKRLGDGFYEQRLVREQVAQLTGRRFLEGYGDDEAQYRALMDNGATFAQSHHLRPGVALSAEQMAALTSDIVWLVEETVTLADGSSVPVLVPKVYVRVREGDLQASGALIAGGSVGLDVGDELVNSGTIAGRTVVALTAENVRNLGGRIFGNDVGVQARGDLDNLGGTISATNSLIATAGRDLNAISPTRSQANNNGRRTNIERVAGLYVTGGSGALIAAAGRDLNLQAAAVDNGGSGATVLSAGKDLNLGTVEESASNRIVWDRANHRSDASRTDVGTIVQAKGDLRLQAGNDLNLKAAEVAAEIGDLRAMAGRDVNLRTGEAYVFFDEAHRSTSKGMFSTTTTTSRDRVTQTSALGTTLSGETAVIFAGRDINVLGGNIVSTADTFLAAGEHIDILAATDFLSEYHFKQERKAGLLGSGGVGFAIGSQVKSTEQKGGYASAAASTIGSVEGDVSILAGRNYLQAGSNVLAPRGDIDIHGQQVDILEARETGRSTIESKFRKSGLTIALTSPVISAVQTAQQMRSAAKATKNARMKALAGATTVLVAGNAAQAVGETPQTAGGFGISITVGGSRNESTTTETSDTAALSQVRAGKDIRIAATGAGRESDLTLQGAQVEGGGSVTLKAEDELKLLAAHSESDLHRKSTGASGGIGVAVQVGKGVAAGITVNASGSRGKAEGDDVIHSNTHVEAGDTVTLQSGDDTTLRGGVVAGERVRADIGGNLTIESLQDESHYHSKDQSVGGSITVGYGFAAGGASYGKSKIDSDFISVVEQSGILAGDGGFDVTVRGGTNLKGGVIASTDTAVVEDRNRFVAASLTMSDIVNRAEYDAKGFSVGGSYGTGEAKAQQGHVIVNKDGTSKMVNSPAASAGFGQNSDSTASVTTSGISGIAGNAEVRTGDRATGIKPIFDAERVQKEINAQVAITQQFGQQADQAVATYMTKARQMLSEQAKEAKTEEERQAIETRLGELKTEERVLNILIGAVTGQAGAAVTKEALSAAADQMRQMMIEDSKKFPGVTDGITTLSNDSGASEGVRGDGKKVGGTRVDLDLLCGEANERCLTNEDGSLKYNNIGMVIFDVDRTKMSLAEFLETDEGKKMVGPTGGIQGVQGTLFGIPYAPGSWQDKLIEAFSGPHDYLGGSLTGLYDEQGNIKRGMNNAERLAYDNLVTTSAIPVAAPFAAADSLPPDVWQAISIILRSAK